MDLLNSIGDTGRMLHSVLRLALGVLGAQRGLAFEGTGAPIASGFSQEHAEFLRSNRLSDLSSGDLLVCFTRPGFAQIGEPGEPCLGIAAMIATRTTMFVLAIEREVAPFTFAEQREVAELIQIVRRPLERTADLAWLKRERELLEDKIQNEGLALRRLEKLPHIAELERMLIEEALHRFDGNKARAAAALGVSREGLRKKITRLHVRIEPA
jgi:hypothetical protein